MIRLSELFVIIYYMDWVGLCLEGDFVYTSREQAQQKITALKETPYAIQQKIEYQVMPLDDYINAQCKQAMNEAKYPIH